MVRRYALEEWLKTFAAIDSSAVDTLNDLKQLSELGNRLRRNAGAPRHDGNQCQGTALIECLNCSGTGWTVCPTCGGRGFNFVLTMGQQSQSL
jgi:hypothetical protein